MRRRRTRPTTCGPTRTAPPVERPALGRRPTSAMAEQAGVGRARSAHASAPTRPATSLVGGRAVGSLDAGDPERPGGERAGLVDAHDVDARQHLDRRQLLHQGLAAGQRGGADGEGEAGEQHEALGDDGADPGHRAPQRLADRRRAAELRTRRRTTVAGTITQVPTVRMVSVPRRSSLFTEVNALASRARPAA